MSNYAHRVLQVTSLEDPLQLADWSNLGGEICLQASSTSLVLLNSCLQIGVKQHLSGLLGEVVDEVP